MRHIYITEGIDAQKCIDDANRMLTAHDEPTTIHYHAFGSSEDGKHKYIRVEEPAEASLEEKLIADLKQRLTKAANMLDNYDSDRLPYEHMLEFNDFRMGLKKLLLQGVE